MKLDAYSSLAAFLAHWRALRRASTGASAADELARRAAMDEIIAALRPAERAALEAANIDHESASAGAALRHRERAELQLARELRTRGLLAG
ncbi:MAG TPA: hypothetical protein VNE82_12340 [Candidatus Binataceae bacterium]|nr:hypothetical protein [Candidatus Binataceae bacterium]